MVFIVYIIHSLTIDKFYIGCTSDLVDERIRKHLTDHKGFISRAKDWQLVYSEVFDNKHDALRREKEIKGWKSKIRIRQLIDSAK